MARGLGERVRGWTDWLLVSVVEGGAAGRWAAAMALYALIAPIGTVELALYGALTPRSFALRAAVLGGAVLYLSIRRRPTPAEWYVVGALLPAISNAQGQWLGAPTLGVVFAVNACLVIACVSIVFDAPFLVAATVTYTVSTYVAQSHLHAQGTALGVTAAVALGISLLGVFVHGAAYRLRRVAAERAELYTERETLFRRMQSAADQERVRIAGELHDDAVQALAASTIQLDAAVARLGDHEVAPVVRAARDTVGGAVDRIRSLSFDLYPAQLDAEGLPAAVTLLAGDLTQDGNRVDVAVSIAPGRFDPAAERLAYRTFKELAGNALKHADARTLRLSAVHDEFELRGTVEDDGRGYDAAQHETRRRSGHIGLDTTAERLRLAGGELTIRSAPGAGTRVEFTIPFRPPGEIAGRAAVDEPPRLLGQDSNLQPSG